MRLETDEAREVIHELTNFLSPGVFAHPLRGLDPNSDGLVPFADSQDTVDGRRYGIETSVAVDEEGNETKFLGVVAYPVRKLTDEERRELDALKFQVGAERPPRLENSAPKIGEGLAQLLRGSAKGERST